MINKILVLFILICGGSFLFAKSPALKNKMDFSADTTDQLRKQLMEHPNNLELRSALIKKLVDEKNVETYGPTAIDFEEIYSLVKEGCIIDRDRMIKGISLNESIFGIMSSPEYTESGIAEIYETYLSSARNKITIFPFPIAGVTLSVPGHYIEGPMGFYNRHHSPPKFWKQLVHLHDPTDFWGEPGTNVPLSIDLFICSTETYQQRLVFDPYDENEIPIKANSKKIEANGWTATRFFWTTPGIEHEVDYLSDVVVPIGPTVVVLSFRYTVSGYNENMAIAHEPYEKLISEIVSNFKLIH